MGKSKAQKAHDRFERRKEKRSKVPVKNNSGNQKAFATKNANAKKPNLVSNDKTKEIIPTVPVLIKDHGDKKGGHPHVIVDNVDDKHVSVGITSDQFKGKNHPNIKLEADPLGKQKLSYIKRQGTVDNVKAYKNPRSGMMTVNDHEKAQQIGAKAKAKYLLRKQQKEKKEE